MENSIIGTEVDGYRIQEVLGRGGMGVVYKAEDTALSRNVALKRIAPSLANDESFLRRFRSEAQALARIDSPYIVGVHALRQTEIGLLIVMEYVAGGTLEDLMLEGPMDWPEVLPLVEQMLKALEHAHGEEVIHRDIKPQNVMLGAEKTVKVTDFGLAKVHRGDSKATVTQGVHGTLNYMSPEQVKGSADLDHRSDLYSLGMTVYEMLAGELPFDEDSDEFAQMRTIVEEDLPPPDEYNPEVPHGISTLVMTALEKNPDDRYQSAEEMREAFEAFEEKYRGAASPSEPRTEPSQGATTTSETGSRWPIAAGLALVVLSVAGVLLWQTRYDQTGDDGSNEPPPNPPPQTTQLSVSTEPPGAAVRLNGAPIGTAPPLDTTIEGRTAEVQVRQAGHVPFDTIIQLEGKKEVDLELSLTREATPLRIRTNPVARVSLDGKSVGRAPLSRKIKKEHVRVRAERQGYSPVDTTVSLAQTEQARLKLQLDPIEKPEGTFTLNASPSGTVSVDGERYTAGASIQVTVGERHQIRIEHPSYGRCDTTLTVEAGGNKMLTCHFEHAVRVQTGLNEPWTNVYIDGKNTGHQTPHDTFLTTGSVYEIGARIQRDPRTAISGGTHLKQWEESDRTAEQKKFTGRSTTITLRPSFVQKTHVVDFRASESEP